MPAECAVATDVVDVAPAGVIAACGTTAIGHCHRCERDFCSRHCFVTRHGAIARDLCGQCGVAVAEAQAYARDRRESALSRIHTIARSLISEGLPPREVFAWTNRTEYRWWAFRGFGHYQVEIPLRQGWAVGEYPWEGMVEVSPGNAMNEVFVKPTFVDTNGEIAPQHDIRPIPANLDLLTDEMCQDIAIMMETLAARARHRARADARDS